MSKISMTEPKIDISPEACAVACMLVSNPQGALRRDGDGWQKRVNDLIRAQGAEIARLRAAFEEIARLRERLATIIIKDKDIASALGPTIARAALAPRPLETTTGPYNCQYCGNRTETGPAECYTRETANRCPRFALAPRPCPHGWTSKEICPQCTPESM